MTSPLTLRAARPAVWMSEVRRAQIAFLVGIQDRHQRHLGDVESLAQQIDADEPVELAQAQIADDRDPVERVDVGMQIAHPQPELLVVLGEVFRHPLGQGRHQDALVPVGPRPELGEQVVDLVPGRAHGDPRIHEAGRPDHLLGERVGGELELVGPGGRGDVDRLTGAPRELVERERSVVERGGHPEPVLDERLLARAVAVVHAADLRHGDVALVDDDQRVLRQVVDQGRRGLARAVPGQVARVVLDAVAEAELAQHLHVEEGPLLEPLRLEQSGSSGAGRPAARRALPGWSRTRARAAPPR